MSKGRAETHVFYCEEPKFEVAVRCFLIMFNNSESPGCPGGEPRDHVVCLAARHAERQRSPSTTETGDAAAGGAKSKFNNPEKRFFLLTTTALFDPFKAQSATYSSQLSQLA